MPNGMARVAWAASGGYKMTTPPSPAAANPNPSALLRRKRSRSLRKSACFARKSSRLEKAGAIGAASANTGAPQRGQIPGDRIRDQLASSTRDSPQRGHRSAKRLRSTDPAITPPTGPATQRRTVAPSVGRTTDSGNAGPMRCRATSPAIGNKQPPMNPAR